jgi:type II secretory pathway pseudopilin PulG
LLELTVALAIVGVLTSLAGYALTSLNEIGRVNGQTQVVANALRNARARAITERCTFVVQINGPNYNPLAAPPDVPRTPNQILLWRKDDCTSNVGAYVPGLMPNLRDTLVDQYNLAEFSSEIRLPVAVLPTIRLVTESVSIAWQGDGTRLISTDIDADGTSVAVPFAGPLPLTVQELNGDADPSRQVTVPLAGPAVAP